MYALPPTKMTAGELMSIKLTLRCDGCEREAQMPELASLTGLDAIGVFMLACQHLPTWEFLRPPNGDGFGRLLCHECLALEEGDGGGA